jgi:hypothetical protein
MPLACAVQWGAVLIVIVVAVSVRVAEGGVTIIAFLIVVDEA